MKRLSKKQINEDERKLNIVLRNIKAARKAEKQKTIETEEINKLKLAERELRSVERDKFDQLPENVENRKQKTRLYRRKYTKKRLAIDPLFRFSVNVRTLVRLSFKRRGVKKNTRTEQILGCTIAEFKAYIEKQFESWMNWSNYGINKGNINQFWSFDHIIPVMTAKNEADVIRLNHHTNLQPLCDFTNKHIKGDRTDYYETA